MRIQQRFLRFAILGIISAVSATASASNDKEEQYPDDWAQYEFPNQQLPGPSAQYQYHDGAAASRYGAEKVKLPEGFELGEGRTTRITTPDVVTDTSRATPGASDSLPASSEKFVTIFPITYKGIPLSKDSGAMTMVSGDNRLLVVRKRGLPTIVDPTNPIPVVQ